MTHRTDEEAGNELLMPFCTPSREDDAELSALRCALGSYRAATSLWAERRSATQPSLAARARRAERWAALPRWSLATIAVVTIAAGAAHLSQDRGTSGNAASAMAAVQTRSSADEIAADNEMLRSIDAELSYHGRSPVDGSDLTRSTREPQQSPAPYGSDE